MSDRKTRRLTINIPEDLYLELHGLAGKLGVSKKILVAEGLRLRLALTDGVACRIPATEGGYRALAEAVQPGGKA